MIKTSAIRQADCVDDAAQKPSPSSPGGVPDELLLDVSPDEPLLDDEVDCVVHTLQTSSQLPEPEPVSVQLWSLFGPSVHLHDPLRQSEAFLHVVDVEPLELEVDDVPDVPLLLPPPELELDVSLPLQATRLVSNREAATERVRTYIEGLACRGEKCAAPGQGRQSDAPF